MKNKKVPNTPMAYESAKMLLNPDSNKKIKTNIIEALISEAYKSPDYRPLLRDKIDAEIRKGNISSVIEKWIVPISKTKDNSFILDTLKNVASILGDGLRKFRGETPKQKEIFFRQYINPMMQSKISILRRMAFSNLDIEQFALKVNQLLDDKTYASVLKDYANPLAFNYEKYLEKIAEAYSDKKLTEKKRDSLVSDLKDQYLPIRRAYSTVVSSLEKKFQMLGLRDKPEIQEVMDQLIVPTLLSGIKKLIKDSFRLLPSGPLNMELKRLVSGSKADQELAKTLIFNLKEVSFVYKKKLGTEYSDIENADIEKAPDTIDDSRLISFVQGPEIQDFMEKNMDISDDESTDNEVTQSHSVSSTTSGPTPLAQDSLLAGLAGHTNKLDKQKTGTVKTAETAPKSLNLSRRKSI